MPACSMCGTPGGWLHVIGKSNECYTGRVARTLYACQSCDPGAASSEVVAWCSCCGKSTKTASKRNGHLFCSECFDQTFNGHRVGGEVPAGVDW